MTVIAMHRKYFTVYQYANVTNIAITDSQVTITYGTSQTSTLSRADYTYHIMTQ